MEKFNFFMMNTEEAFEGNLKVAKEVRDCCKDFNIHCSDLDNLVNEGKFNENFVFTINKYQAAINGHLIKMGHDAVEKFKEGKYLQLYSHNKNEREFECDGKKPYYNQISEEVESAYLTVYNCQVLGIDSKELADALTNHSTEKDAFETISKVNKEFKQKVSDALKERKEKIKAQEKEEMKQQKEEPKKEEVKVEEPKVEEVKQEETEQEEPKVEEVKQEEKPEVKLSFTQKVINVIKSIFKFVWNVICAPFRFIKGLFSKDELDE